MNKKGFTLIELLAVIVILAIIALIATPIVLNIISDSRKNAIEINFDNLKHSMELYYMNNQMKEQNEFPKRFDFPNDELEMSGQQPDSGFGVIYENGEILLSVKYSDKEFIILPGEETHEEGNYIGLEEDWLTDGNGTLHMYKKYNETDFGKFINYYTEVKKCGSSSELTTDEKIECINNVDIDISTLPEKPKNELIKYKKLSIEYVDATEEPDIDLEKEFPILVGILEQGKIDDSFKDTLTIPNHVLHSDNTLEPITTISGHTESDSEGNKVEYLFFGEFSTDAIYVLDKLIFPSKIEKIDNSIFALIHTKEIDFSMARDLKEIGSSSFVANSILTKVSIPKSVEKIGDYAFMGDGDTFKKLIFEGAEDGTSQLKEIGKSAFARNEVSVCGTAGQSVTHCTGTGYLEGTLYIPATVEKIGNTAFTGMDKLEVKFVGAEDGTSKLKEIGPWAFYNIGNSEEIVLPGSITMIDMYAFAGPKAKYSKMIIKKADSSGINFGKGWTNVTPTYEP